MEIKWAGLPDKKFNRIIVLTYFIPNSKCDENDTHQSTYTAWSLYTFLLQK